MKSLLKKVFSYVSLLLVTSSLYIHGAVEPIKRLHLIPISYNQQTHEYSVLLRKPAQHGEFIDFIAPTHSLLDVDNVAEYMNYFSAQTFGVYSANIIPSTHSTQHLHMKADLYMKTHEMALSLLRYLLFVDNNYLKKELKTLQEQILHGLRFPK